MMINFENAQNHFKKILTHRKWVRHYCFGMGLYKQGFLHDLSKFSPTEFLEGVKYYQGTSSPIDACKKENGYSMAWFHHRGRNYHHYEMWQDDFDHGGKPLLMPYKYFVEMVCDYLGAGRAYMDANFTFYSELNWWNKKREAVAMPKCQIEMLDHIFQELAGYETVHGVEKTDAWFCSKKGRAFIQEVHAKYKVNNESILNY